MGAPPIPDGRYDVFIVDAEPHPEQPDSVVKVEVTITSGEFKGEVIKLHANGISVDLGTPSSPGVFKPVGGGEFTHIVMPMHITR